MASDAADRGPRYFAFGPFVLIPERQVLLRDEVPVRLGGRALDILTALVEQAGAVVSKDELLARVWHDATVEESNLKTNVAALRRALGEGPGASSYIATVVGRGYRFCAPVQSFTSGSSLEVAAPSSPTHNLPTSTTRIFGRERVIDAIRRELDEARLVSLVGPGGIGKTTVALAVAERVAGAFRDGVWLIELALLKDPELVPNAIATTLGVVTHQPNMLAALSEFLRNREILLVLDSGEHVIDAAAACASRILAEAAGVKLLVTSREPLLVNGERVRRLPGLGTPPPSARTKVEEILAFPAIQLFVDRATDRDESFVLSDADAPAVAEICRRLDGLALAIELAATRLHAFGVSGLLKQLDDRFRVLIGRRAGPERHRTLMATLDWSYGLLSPDEAALLRAVSVFAGVFDIGGAAAIANVAHPDAAHTLAQLADKSLLAVDLDADGYRLPETTRTYCLEHLLASGLDPAVRRRHAEHVDAVLQRARREWAHRPARKWGNAYGRVLDDLRGALGWAGRDAVEASLRVRLTVAGILLWTHFGLIEECSAHVAQAIADLDASGLAATELEMQLQLWLGDTTSFTRGPLPEAGNALRRALDIAVRRGDTDGHLRALRLLGVYELFRGENDVAIRTLETFVATAAAEVPSPAHQAETALGIGELFVGRLPRARRRLERLHQLELELHAARDPQSIGYHARYLSDRMVDVDNVLSHVQWLTGSPDAALQMAEATVERALDAKHHLSLSTALSWVCPVFYWTGRDAECTRYATMLEDEAQRYGFAVRRLLAMFYRAALACARADAPADEVDWLARVIEELHATQHLARLPFYLGVQADVLVKHHRLDDARVAIRAAVDRSQAKNELWCRPELLRIEASIFTVEGQATKAEARLAESIALAGDIGARAWRLRAATDLARLWSADARVGDARAMLSAVYAELTEGFATRDVVVAAELLASLDTTRG